MINDAIAKRQEIENRKYEAAKGINNLIAATTKELRLNVADADDFRDAVLALVTEDDS